MIHRIVIARVGEAKLFVQFPVVHSDGARRCLVLRSGVQLPINLIQQRLGWGALK